MGWQGDAAVGIAAHLDGFSIGVWSPTDSAGTIWRGALPPEVNFGIGIQTYRIGADDPANPTTKLRVQFFLRAPDIDTLDSTDEAIYDAFMGLSNVDFGVAHVVDTQSISALSAGVDSRGNAQRTCNYQLDLDLPATALRSY